MANGSVYSSRYQGQSLRRQIEPLALAGTAGGDSPDRRSIGSLEQRSNGTVPIEDRQEVLSKATGIDAAVASRVALPPPMKRMRVAVYWSLSGCNCSVRHSGIMSASKQFRGSGSMSASGSSMSASGSDKWKQDMWQAIRPYGG